MKKGVFLVVILLIFSLISVFAFFSDPSSPEIFGHDSTEITIDTSLGIVQLSSAIPELLESLQEAGHSADEIEVVDKGEFHESLQEFLSCDGNHDSSKNAEKFGHSASEISLKYTNGTIVNLQDFITSLANSINGVETFSYPGLQSWNVPEGVNNITIELWGAGGRGGNGANSYVVSRFYSSGGGGGGGAYVKANVSIPSGVNKLTFYVGNGLTQNRNSNFSLGSDLVVAEGGKDASFPWQYYYVNGNCGGEFWGCNLLDCIGYPRSSNSGSGVFVDNCNGQPGGIGGRGGIAYSSISESVFLNGSKGEWGNYPVPGRGSCLTFGDGGGEGDHGETGCGGGGVRGAGLPTFGGDGKVVISYDYHRFCV